MANNLLAKISNKILPLMEEIDSIVRLEGNHESKFDHTKFVVDSDLRLSNARMPIAHVHTSDQVGADADGSAITAVSNHETKLDPHPQYATYAKLDAGLATKQALSQILSAISALTSAGVLQIKSDGTVLTFTVSDTAKTLLNDADVPAMRTTLGLGSAALRSTGDFEPNGAGAAAAVTAVNNHKNETTAHAIAQINGLLAALDSKQSVFTAIPPNLIFASPATGNAALPSFRALSMSDLPVGLVDTASNQTLTGNKIFSGLFRAQGPVSETPLGVSRLDFGTQNNTARAVFESVNLSGTGSTIWQVDNQDGVFRWFVPGTTRMTLDAAGNLTLPNASRFRASKNATQALLITTWTKISFQTEIYDTQAEFDNATNHRFTAKTAGNYLFSAAINVANTTSGTSASLAFYVNGTDVSRPTTIATGSTAAFSVAATELLRLNANDYVEVYVQLSRALSINSGANLTYFSGVKLS